MSFWPQKFRQMPTPTSSRLTFETGALLRVCKQTGPFLATLPGLRGSGIGPGLFAERGRKLAQQQDRKRSILPSPLKAVLNRRIIAWSGIRTTDSPPGGRLHSLVLAAPRSTRAEVVRHAEFFGDKGSYTPRHSPRFCLRPAINRGLRPRKVMYFWPQKVPKTPRQMPTPTSSRLTFETGAYLSLQADRPRFCQGLRFTASASGGIVRRGKICARTKQEAQKPAIAPGSGFQTRCILAQRTTDIRATTSDPQKIWH